MMPRGIRLCDYKYKIALFHFTADVGLFGHRRPGHRNRHHDRHYLLDLLRLSQAKQEMSPTEGWAAAREQCGRWPCRDQHRRVRDVRHRRHRPPPLLRYAVGTLSCNAGPEPNSVRQERRFLSGPIRQRRLSLGGCSELFGSVRWSSE